jgi:hypothetical protein
MNSVFQYIFETILKEFFDDFIILSFSIRSQPLSGRFLYSDSEGAIILLDAGTC